MEYGYVSRNLVATRSVPSLEDQKWRILIFWHSYEENVTPFFDKILLNI
jgi:hypothetical protein